jgi:CBS domain containing-hemolysin-like protein
MIEQVTGEMETEQQNISIFRNALEFSNVKLREIMVPRTEIEAVPVTGSVVQLREKFISTRFSRILAYKDSKDNITGYFEVKDIFRNPEDLNSILRKLSIVPETMTASRLLRTFVNEKRNIALVVDEFGGTSGMVSIEDLLEQIVGDIEDEHDTSDLIEREVNPGEFIFSGRLEIDYLNETYNLNLPEKQDYETLAGLILFYHGSIPQLNDIIKIDNITIRILRTTSTRIELVNLRKE